MRPNRHVLDVFISHIFYRHSENTSCVLNLGMFMVLQTKRHLSIGVPLEFHAAKVYTRALFARFDKELYRAGAFICRRDDEEGGLFTALFVSRPGYTDSGRTSFQVTRTSDGSLYQCDCKMFEHSGMPCRHILCVRFLFFSANLMFCTSIFVL